MSVDGIWLLAIDSPMGTQDFAVDLVTRDGALTGTLTNRGNNISTEIFDGVVDGGELRWKAKLKQLHMTVSFTTTVQDDTMSGNVKAGLFGSFAVTGKRG